MFEWEKTLLEKEYSFESAKLWKSYEYKYLGVYMV